jgi:hypothetical protein
MSERAADFVPTGLAMRALTEEERATERARARLVLARVARLAGARDELAEVWAALGVD